MSDSIWLVLEDDGDDIVEYSTDSASDEYIYDDD